MSTDPVAPIAEAILSREPVGGIRIVGVDGPSGSGKTHLATRLAAALRAPVVPVDDFVSWDCFAGWWPRFDEQVLTPLSAGRDARYQARDWSDWYGSALGEWKTVRWAPVVIVEGVTCTRLAAAARLAYTIWVDAPAELRLARGLERDAGYPGAEELWRAWMRQEDEFFAADGTRDRADLVL